MNELWTLGHHVELQEMLDGRETRAKMQSQMLSFCPDSSIICFTLNIAGPVKVNALTDEAFYAGCEAIEDILSMAGIEAECEIAENDYGHEGYYVISEEEESAEEIKYLMTEIEEEHELGRLFDIDVIRSNGEKVSRTEIGMEPRRCLICENTASECASTRAHSVEELRSATYDMIAEYLNNEIPVSMISRMAYASMMNEVATTPKPGLVDLSNNGAHKDMTPETFEASAQAIKQFFSDCYAFAKNTCGNTDGAVILERVRGLGLEAEKKMLEATGGVNTHKGLIFSLGIICIAIGICERGAALTDILDRAGYIAENTLSEKPLRGITGGARTEAASGFMSVRNISMPAYEEALQAGVDINTAGVYALLKLIASVDDTNMIYRAGEDKAVQMKSDAGVLATEFEGVIRNSDKTEESLEVCTGLFLQKVVDLDEKYIEANVSPGGCADLLAITYFLKMLKDIL